MIKRPKKNLISPRESEAEKAVRRFFGTFASDIRRNWTLPQTFKIKRKTHHDVSQLANPI
jgi:hypothetical protein